LGASAGLPFAATPFGSPVLIAALATLIVIDGVDEEDEALIWSVRKTVLPFAIPVDHQSSSVFVDDVSVETPL